MYTLSDILLDVEHHCMANNIIEDRFLYRLVYFVNTENGNRKHYADTSYDGLRIVLENIVRENLTTTNNIVLAAVVILKDGRCVPMLSRSYLFSMEEYFKQLTGRRKKRNNLYNSRYASAIY